MVKKDLGMPLRASLPMIIEGLDEVDSDKIEVWYGRISGKKSGLGLISDILSREVITGHIRATSIEAIDDISFVLDDGIDKVLISLVLNIDKPSKIIIAKTYRVIEYSFLIKRGLISEKVYIKKNLTLENESVYRVVLEDILGIKKEAPIVSGPEKRDTSDESKTTGEENVQEYHTSMTKRL